MLDTMRPARLIRALGVSCLSYGFLANIKQEGLLTEEELMQFSPEAREGIEVIETVRRA